MTAPTTPVPPMPAAVEAAIIALATAGTRYGAADELATSAEAHGLDGYPFWEAVDDAVEARNAADDALRAAIAAYGRECAAEAEARAERLRVEAETWAQEARTQRATVHEAYQAATGATGEPGDWHGAAPIRAALAAEREAGRAEALAEVDAAIIATTPPGTWTIIRPGGSVDASPVGWTFNGTGHGPTPTAAIQAAAAALDGEADGLPFSDGNGHPPTA